MSSPQDHYTVEQQKALNHIEVSIGRTAYQ